LAFFAHTIYSYLSGLAIQGWTTLMTVVLILGSAQLFVLGVIGEYLGRLYMQSKNRPLFIIEEVVRLDSQENEHRRSFASATIASATIMSAKGAAGIR
jgi:dolichol-phosphate mannosyltransferase